MRYTIVIAKANNNSSVHVPDLRGCVATGATAEEAGLQCLGSEINWKRPA
jgi:predicted RNase H-like HicB family nuclease